MNNRIILIGIYCPAVSKRYDFCADDGLLVSQAVKLALREIMEYENNSELFSIPENTAVFTSLSSKPLDPSVKLCDYGIVSGSELIII
ncbi:MAG: hypothetical protein Q4F95_05625 [Oscillospiraceae bacterium]|nr:hypothetical protein [Oscillospiraceae bacterium]